MLVQNKGEGTLISIAAEGKVGGVKTKNKTRSSEVSATETLGRWMINSRGDFLFADDEIIKKLMIVVDDVCWCFPSVQSAFLLLRKLECLTQTTVYSDGKLRRDFPTRFVNFTFEQFIFLYSLFVMFHSVSWHWWSTQLRLTSKMGKKPRTFEGKMFPSTVYVSLICQELVIYANSIITSRKSKRWKSFSLWCWKVRVFSSRIKAVGGDYTLMRSFASGCGNCSRFNQDCWININ